MLKFFPQWIKRLAALGIDDNTTEADSNSINTCNVLNLFVISGFLLFIVISCIYKWWSIVFCESCFILVLSGSLILNSYKQYQAAKYLFLLSFFCFIVFFSWMDHRNIVNVYNYLFLLPLIVFLLFDSNQILHISISLLAVVFVYFIISEIKSPFHFQDHLMGELDERVIHLINVVIIFSIISFIAYHFAKGYNSKNSALIIKKKQLVNNHSLAKAGYWYYSLNRQAFNYSDEMKEIFATLQSVQKLKPDFFLNFLSENDKVRFVENRTKSLKEKVSVEDDYEINLKNGNKKFIVAVIQPALNLDGEVRGLQGVCVDVSEERKAQLYLQEHLHEKEVLLDEMHHRIAYNLSLITGFVQLQMLTTKDEHVKEMLDVCRQRIATMSIIHEKMYASNFNAIMFDDYLRDLIKNISKSIETDELKIKVNTQFDTVMLPYNNLLPSGLILNELITNSYKHAFRVTTNGTINIAMKLIENTIIITYQDNGSGYDLSKESNGIGMDLIQSLTQQLKGTIEIKNKNGFYCELKFNAGKD